MTPFKVTEPTAPVVPIVISVPHCGVAFPEKLRDQYDSKLIAAPDDTDWFVDQLYDFTQAMGMTMISAVYSRWVIDLNRDPDSKPLYTDGRIITALCPATTFLGEPLYKDKRKEVATEDVQSRLENYYRPYHEKIQELLDERIAKFGKVLLWDCHSIRQVVSTIQQDKFPDLILGSADGNSADKNLIDTALGALKGGPYQLQHNHPFKGGFITRNFGKPSLNQHALQLEMTKVNYMDDAEIKYDLVRANKVRELLGKTFGSLIEQLRK